MDPSSEIWTKFHSVIEKIPVDPSFTDKLEAIRQNGLYLSAIHEQDMLRKEMQNVILFWQEKKKTT